MILAWYHRTMAAFYNSMARRCSRGLKKYGKLSNYHESELLIVETRMRNKA